MIEIPRHMATINAPMTRDVLGETGAGTLRATRDNRLPVTPMALRKVNPSFDAARRTGPPVEVKHSLVTKGGLPVHVRSANAAPSQVGLQGGYEWGQRGVGEVAAQQTFTQFLTSPGGLLMVVVLGLATVTVVKVLRK